MAIQRFNPQVLVLAEVSVKTTGMSKSIAYSLIILLAIFLGILVAVGSAFVAKVKERMASRS